MPLDRVPEEQAQREGLLEAAERRSTARSEPARRLLHAPESLRTDLLDLLDLLGRAARALEPDLARAARAISGQLPGLRRAVEHDGPGRALAALDPAASYRDGPPRVVFDKFHHGIVNVATAPVPVVPSVFGGPHLLVKHEPGFAAVVQYRCCRRPTTSPVARPCTGGWRCCGTPVGSASPGPSPASR